MFIDAGPTFVFCGTVSELSKKSGKGGKGTTFRKCSSSPLKIGGRQAFPIGLGNFSGANC